MPRRLLIGFTVNRNIPSLYTYVLYYDSHVPIRFLRKSHTFMSDFRESHWSCATKIPLYLSATRHKEKGADGWHFFLLQLMTVIKAVIIITTPDKRWHRPGLTPLLRDRSVWRFSSLELVPKRRRHWCARAAATNQVASARDSLCNGWRLWVLGQSVPGTGLPRGSGGEACQRPLSLACRWLSLHLVFCPRACLCPNLPFPEGCQSYRNGTHPSTFAFTSLSVPTAAPSPHRAFSEVWAPQTSAGVRLWDTIQP